MEKLAEHLDPSLVERLGLYYDMSETLRQHLPPILGESCWCSHLEGQTLTISVPDSQQASLLHCHQREILKHLNALYAERTGGPLKRIHIHVAPPQPASRDADRS